MHRTVPSPCCAGKSTLRAAATFTEPSPHSPHSPSASSAPALCRALMSGAMLISPYHIASCSALAALLPRRQNRGRTPQQSSRVLSTPASLVDRCAVAQGPPGRLKGYWTWRPPPPNAGPASTLGDGPALALALRQLAATIAADHPGAHQRRKIPSGGHVRDQLHAPWPCVGRVRRLADPADTVFGASLSRAIIS
jgi:hypothetical protein